MHRLQIRGISGCHLLPPCGVWELRLSVRYHGCVLQYNGINAVLKTWNFYPFCRLKSLDLVTMKKLDSKVNIIPVVAKSDTITKAELTKFKVRWNMMSCVFCYWRSDLNFLLVWVDKLILPWLESLLFCAMNFSQYSFSYIETSCLCKEDSKVWIRLVACSGTSKISLSLLSLSIAYEVNPSWGHIYKHDLLCL